MLNISRTNEDILMKLSVDLPHDVIVQWWWVHGYGTICMVAMPTLPKAGLLLNMLQKSWQKIKIFQKFFLHVFMWCQKLLSAILRDLKNFPRAFQPIYFQMSLDEVWVILVFYSLYYYCLFGWAEHKMVIIWIVQKSQKIAGSSPIDDSWKFWQKLGSSSSNK